MARGFNARVEARLDSLKAERSKIEASVTRHRADLAEAKADRVGVRDAADRLGRVLEYLDANAGAIAALDGAS